MADSAFPWRVAAALLLAVVVAFGPLVQAGFVWDDIPLVVQNTLTGDLANVPQLFQVDLWQTAGGVEADSGYYRPLMLVSLALDRALWGLSAAGHHAHSVAWHLAACVALVTLLRQLADGPGVWLGAGLFALHPVQTEAVAWVAARNDLMAAAFLFAGVAALLPRAVSPKRLALGGGLVLLGMLSKESAVFAVALLFLLDLARFGRPVGPARYLAAGGAVAVWFGLRSLAGIEGASVPDAEQLGWLVRNLGEVGGHYLLKVLAPYPLSNGETAEYLAHGLPKLAAAWLAALALVVLVVRRGGRVAAAGLVLAALALLPALLTVAVRGQLGERYLYLPIGGVALAAAAAWPHARRIRWGGLAAGVLAVGLIALRVPDWRSDVDLWGSAVQATPNPYAYTSLALAHVEADQHAQAVPWLIRALEDPEPYVDACAPGVRVPLKLGDVETAAHAARLTEGCHGGPRLAGLRAMALFQVGDFDEAARVVEPVAGQEDARLPLVEAALALSADDVAAADAIAQRMPDPAAFSQQARALLGVGLAARDSMRP